MSHIEVRLPGFFEPSLEVPSERVRIDFAAAPEEPDGPPPILIHAMPKHGIFFSVRHLN